MKDEIIVTWLQTAIAIAELARASNTPLTEPRDLNVINIETEGFSRWMGWRGQDEQEREIDWPPDMVRTERNARHMRAFKKLREENEEFRRFLLSLRDELNRRLGN